VEVHVPRGPQQTPEASEWSDQPTLYWVSISGYPESTLTLLSSTIESGRSANVWLIADWRDGLEVAVQSPRQLKTEEDEQTLRRQVMEKIWGDGDNPPPDNWQHVTILRDHTKILQDPILGPRFMRAREEAQRRRQKQRERWMSMTQRERERWRTMVDEERDAELERLRTTIDGQLRTLEHRRPRPGQSEPEKEP
jgi:hypothetical protein